MAEFTKVKESKNLATCKPSEFLRQTCRIRKSVEKWLEKTKIMEIRSRKVEGLQKIPADADVDTVAEIRRENAKKITAQQRKNFNDMLTAALEECPDETLELLGAICFIEPEDVDNHKVTFYLNNLAEIMSDEDVLGFFTSFAQLGQTGILKA